MFTTCVSLVPNSQLTRLRIGAKCIWSVHSSVCLLGAHTYLLFARQKEEKNNNKKSKQVNNKQRCHNLRHKNVKAYKQNKVNLKQSLLCVRVFACVFVRRFVFVLFLRIKREQKQQQKQQQKQCSSSSSINQ